MHRVQTPTYKNHIQNIGHTLYCAIDKASSYCIQLHHSVKHKARQVGSGATGGSGGRAGCGGWFGRCGSDLATSPQHTE